VAYASISASGAAVSLYQPATRSLALFEKVSSDVAEYDNGMTYGTGALVSLNGTVYRLINFIGAGGYGPISHPYLWEDGRVPATGGPPPISNTNTQVTENGIVRIPFGFTPAQNTTSPTMAKIGCEISQEVDADGDETSCAVYPKYRYTQIDGTVVSERLGQINTDGCHYPSGFKQSSSEPYVGAVSKTHIIESLDFGGQSYAPVYSVELLLYYQENYNISDGNGGTSFASEYGIAKTRTDGRAGRVWEDDYLIGDVPYKAFGSFLPYTLERVGSPTPNGRYIVNYKSGLDETIYGGAWCVSISGGVGPSRSAIWKFEPDDASQPVPPPCMVKKRIINPLTNEGVNVCDPAVKEPFRVTESCGESATVSINEELVVVGTNEKWGMDNGYGEVVWGNCRGMVYYPSGVQISEDTDYRYFSDGGGSYYQELKEEPCPSDGSLISSDSNPIEVTINGATYNVGTHTDSMLADGSCGSREESSDLYVPNGTYLTEDSTYLYYSDGAGDYYTELVDDGGGEDCEPAGTFISAQTIVESTVEICGTTVSLGDADYATYADGSCGTYTSTTSNNFIPSGTNVGTCAELDYFSDGNGGYYTQDNGSGDGGGDQCEDPALHGGEDGWTYDGCHWSYSEPQEPQIVGYEGQEDFLTVSTLTVVNRTRVRPQYDNGSVGEWTDWNYVPEGTLYGSDNEFNYYSDGAGSYYTEPVTPSCPQSGTQISSDSGSYDVDFGCGAYSSGTYGSITYADGNCGTYTEGGANYVGSGTLLANCNDYNYYANGSGGYYQGEFTGTPPSCDSYGTQLSSDGGTQYVNVGCEDWSVGDVGSTTYADGNCGTYTDYFSNYVSNGTYLGNCNDYNYYSNGSGGYYQGEYTGTDYPTGPTGSGGSATNYITINGAEYENGTYSYSEYHDGMGGYYTEYAYYYQSYGYTFVTTSIYDEETLTEVWTQYQSDGNGGYYTT
jgi:hypothetical protein